LVKVAPVVETSEPWVLVSVARRIQVGQQRRVVTRLFHGPALDLLPAHVANEREQEADHGGEQRVDGPVVVPARRMFRTSAVAAATRSITVRTPCPFVHLWKALDGLNARCPAARACVYVCVRV